MPLPNISTQKFTLDGGTSGRTLGARCSEVLTPFDFNPLGLDLAGNVVNASPALQAMFDTAFGDSTTPHGLANAGLNRPCYIPPGQYNLESPLNLTQVVGGSITGGGLTATQLVYSGAWTTETPVLNINGMAHTTFRGISFNNAAGQNSCGVYYYWDGDPGGDGLHDNTFFMCGLSGKYGLIVGDVAGQGPVVLIGCIGSGSKVAGTIGIDIRNDSAQVTVIHPSMTDWGILYKAHKGTLCVFGGSSETEDANFDIDGANTMVTAIGNRSESLGPVYRIANGILHATSTNHGVDIPAHAPATFSTFAEITGGIVFIEGCYLNANTGQTGIDKILGDGGRLYLRGNNTESGYRAEYTGTVEMDI